MPTIRQLSGSAVRLLPSTDELMVEVAIELGTQLLVQALVFYSEKGARDRLLKCLEDGSAKAKFGQMVAAQGGPGNFVTVGMTTLI